MPITVLRTQMSKKRKSAGQVLPITVLRTQMSKKRKSAGQVLPISVLRNSPKTVISNTDMGFRMICRQQLVKSAFKGLDEWVSAGCLARFQSKILCTNGNTGERYLYCNMLFVDST